LALKPGVVDNSTLGDIRMIDCSTYYGNTLFLRMHGRGIPIIQNSSIADIEFSDYFLLQYDDIPDAQVNIAGPLPVGATFQKARLVHKPGTILAEYPRNLQISTSDRWKGNTNLVHFEAAGVGSSAPTYAPVVNGASAADLHLSKDGALNVINGNTYLDQLASGVSVDTGKLMVSGGSEPGINGTYYRSDRIYDATLPQGAYNIASYTNTAFAIVLGDADYGMGFGYGGGFYALGDSNCLHTLYYRPYGTVADIAPGFTLPYVGIYVADAGTGTPPTVSASLITNTTTLLGPLTVRGTITGNGFALTNLNLVLSGTNAVPPKDTRRIKAWVNITLPTGEVMKMPLYQ
jgi:hypothetical protein